MNSFDKIIQKIDSFHYNDTKENNSNLIFDTLNDFEECICDSVERYNLYIVKDERAELSYFADDKLNDLIKQYAIQFNDLLCCQGFYFWFGLSKFKLKRIVRKIEKRNNTLKEENG